MNRFTRYKTLQQLWTRARSLLGWLNGPQHHQLRARTYRWQQVQVAERQIMDGYIRGPSDPDSTVRPAGIDRSAQWVAQRQWQAAAQQHWQRQRR